VKKELDIDGINTIVTRAQQTQEDSQKKVITSASSNASCRCCVVKSFKLSPQRIRPTKEEAEAVERERRQKNN
jgi:hypothetical protein